MVKFPNLIKLADVMLHPFPFGGSRTSLDGLEAGVPVVFVVADSAPRGGPLIPADVARDAVAVILPDLPRPLRTRWYGMFWQDKISPGWRGDVLVWT